MRKTIIARFCWSVTLVTVPLSAALWACSSDETGAAEAPDATTTADGRTAADSPTNEASADTASDSSKDGGASCDPGAAQVLTTFRGRGMDYNTELLQETLELPEGMTLIPSANADSWSTPVVAFGFIGRAVAVDPNDGGVSTWNKIQPFTLGTATSSSKLVGLIYDTKGEIGPAGTMYGGLANLVVDAGTTPAPRIYKIPPPGSADASVIPFSEIGNPAMVFPQGLEIANGFLWVSDGAAGAIYRVAPDGTVATWLKNPLLVGNRSACSTIPITTPRDFGVRQTLHIGNDVYVTNSDYGSLLKIPVNADGTAGPISTVFQDCKYQGIRSIVLDTDGKVIAFSLQQSKMWKVDLTTRKAEAWGPQGKPTWDQPAEARIDKKGNERRLVVINFGRDSWIANGIALDAGFEAGKGHNVTVLPLPSCP
jgi:hypothetical protein